MTKIKKLSTCLWKKSHAKLYFGYFLYEDEVVRTPKHHNSKGLQCFVVAIDIIMRTLLGKAEISFQILNIGEPFLFYSRHPGT